MFSPPLRLSDMPLSARATDVVHDERRGRRADANGSKLGGITAFRGNRSNAAACSTLTAPWAAWLSAHCEIALRFAGW